MASMRARPAILNRNRSYARINMAETVVPAVKKSDFPLANQLTQVLLSILSGCEYLSQVNTRLRPERKLAQV